MAENDGDGPSGGQHREWSLTIAFLTLLLGATACGGGSGAHRPASASGEGRAAQTVAVRADPSGRLAWERAEYTATAGDVTFVVSTPPGLTHDFAVEGPEVRLRSAPFAGGSTQHFTLQGLAPGAYQIICHVPGHREAGMIATLRVHETLHQLKKR